MIYLICRSKSEDFGLSRSQFHFLCWLTCCVALRNSQKQTRLIVAFQCSKMFQGAHRGWGCFGSLGCTGRPQSIQSPEMSRAILWVWKSREKSKVPKMFQRCSDFLWFSWIWSLLLSRLALMILMRRSTFWFPFLCVKECCKKWTRRITWLWCCIHSIIHFTESLPTPGCSSGTQCRQGNEFPTAE